MSTSREELADRLEAFLRVLESARRCGNKAISVWSGDVEVVSEALDVVRLAATPKEGVDREVIVGIIEDKIEIKIDFESADVEINAGPTADAILALLPSVLGGVEQKSSADCRQCNEQSAQGLSPPWQTIDSAPTDGTPFIGAFWSIRWADSHRKGDVVRCWYQPEFKAFISSCREMEMRNGYTFDDGSTRQLHSPRVEPVTHWMPLIAPTAVAETDARNRSESTPPAVFSADPTNQPPESGER